MEGEECRWRNEKKNPSSRNPVRRQLLERPSSHPARRTSYNRIFPPLRKRLSCTSVQACRCIDRHSSFEIKAKERRPRDFVQVSEMRGISSSRPNSYYDETGTKTSTTTCPTAIQSYTGNTGRNREGGGTSTKRSWIVFCFVQRVGGHDDDRMKHKRGAPGGVTGHKIPLRRDSLLHVGVEMSALPRFPI